METGVDFRIDPTQRICEDCGKKMMTDVTDVI